MKSFGLFWNTLITAAALGLLLGFAAGVRADSTSSPQADVPGWRFESFSPAAATTAESLGTTPAAGDKDTSKSAQVQAAPAKRKPVVLTVYTSKAGCRACHNFLKWRESNASKIGCEVKHLQYAKLEDSSVSFPNGLPAFCITDHAGKATWFMGWSLLPEHEAGTLCPLCLIAFVQHSKGVPTIEFDKSDVQVAQPVGTDGGTALEQALRYAGPSGRFTFVPDQPIDAKLDDRTELRYTQVSGTYQIAESGATLTLDAPLPQVFSRKWFWRFGATLQGADFTPPATIGIKTNRGRYRVSLEQFQ